jgi:hypothetical protein
MTIKKAQDIMERLAKTVEALLFELHRRGARVDVDLSDYDKYRQLWPRQDA